MQNTSIKLHSARRARDGKEATQCGETVLKKRQHLEREGGLMVRDVVSLSLKELLEAAESRETWLSVDSSYARMLAELLRDGALRSFA